MTDHETSSQQRPPVPRLALLASVCVLALGTCAPGLTARSVGGGDAEGEVLGVATERLDESRAGDVEPRTIPPLPDDSEPLVRGRIRPAPVPDEPDDAAPVGDDFPEIMANRPAVRLSGATAVHADLVRTVLHVEGVTAATAFRVASLPLAVGEDEAVTVAVVDPAEFRHLTPQVTAEAVDVWRRVSEGDAAFTHDVGHRLEVDHDIELGERVPVLDGGQSVRIGAYASNGVPPVAEAVVSTETGEQLGLDGEPTVLVALAEGVAPDDVLPALEQATGLAGEVIPEPTERRAFLTGTEAREAFEPFTYVSLGDGMIQIDAEWVRRNIVRARVPVFQGEVVCHRLMIPQLRGALQEVVDRGLDHLIDTPQYGGCWVPRHILFNPSNSLSMHAWGLAIDFNVSTNQYAAEPQMDPRIVEIFERWGFAWGGRWSTPDGMHFELAALLESPD